MSSYLPLIPKETSLKFIPPELNFGAAFNLLPFEVIDRIFRDLLTQERGPSFFCCVRQLNKSFHLLTSWRRQDSIPLQMPFNHVHLIRAIRLGNQKVMQKLLVHPQVDFEPKKSNNMSVLPKEDPDFFVSPFVAAIKANQTEIFKELWKKNSEQNPRYEMAEGSSYLALAIRKGSLEIAEFLLRNNVSIPANLPTLAIESENIAILNKFIPPGTFLYGSDSHCRAFLIQAVNQFTPQTKEKNIETIRYLLSNVKIKSRYLCPVGWGMNQNPLYIAMKHRDADLCLLLWNSKLFELSPSLFEQACLYGHHQLVTEFLKTPGFQIQNPIVCLNFARQGNHIELMKILLRSPQISRDPLLRSTVEVLKTIAFYSALAIFASFAEFMSECFSGALSGALLLKNLKVAAVIGGVLIAITIATGIIYELGVILSHALTLARPAAYLAHHQFKVWMAGKQKVV